MDIKIPRDPRDFEPKFIMGFTMRQFIAFLCIIGIAYINVVIQKKLLGFDKIVNMPIIIPSLVPLFFGFGKSLVGMPPEQYLRLVFISAFIAPKIRVFRTHNLIEEYEKAAVIEDEKEKRIKKEEEDRKNRKNKKKKKYEKPVETPEYLVEYY